MKRELIVIAVLLFSSGFFPGVWAAGLPCPDNQIILKLSDVTNAHGELWNQQNYQTIVCYKDLFGTTYAGPNIQTCSNQNANLVLALSDVTNAHAATTAGGAYNSKVCYGDLSCIARGMACLNGETEVVSLSGTTNAHLELASQTNYPTRICCVSPSAGGGTCGNGQIEENEQCDGANHNDQTCQTLGYAQGDLSCTAQCTFDKSDCSGQQEGNEVITLTVWQNSNWNTITTSTIGATVKLVANTTGVSQGATLNFEVRERDGNGNADDDILVGNNALTASVDQYGKAYISWKIPDSAAMISAKGDEGNDKDLELYFKAIVANKPTVFKESATLKTSPDEVDQCIDYSTQDSCNGDIYDIVQDDLLWDDHNCDSDGTPTECMCSWKTDGLQKCVFKVINHNDEDDDNPDTCESTTCLVTNYTEGECVDGFQTITISRESPPNACGERDPTCVDSVETLFCAKPTVQLPFFGFWQLLSTLLVIAGMYYGFYRKQHT